MIGGKIILSSGEGRGQCIKGVDQKQIQLQERNVYVVVMLM